MNHYMVQRKHFHDVYYSEQSPSCEYLLASHRWTFQRSRGPRVLHRVKFVLESQEANRDLEQEESEKELVGELPYRENVLGRPGETHCLEIQQTRFLEIQT